MTEQHKEQAIEVVKNICHVLHEKRYEDLPSCVDKMEWDDTEVIRECIQGTLEMNDALCQMYYAKSGLARLAYKILTHFLNKSIEKGEPNLNLMFNYNMPFRAIAKMTGGICTMEMAEGILTIVNGHFFKGLGRVIGGFFRSGKKRMAANAMK